MLRRLLTVNTDYVPDIIRPVDFYNEKCERLLWGRNCIIIHGLDELTYFERCAVVKAVSPLIAKTRVGSSVSPCGNCCGRSATVTGFSPSISVSPCQYQSINAPYSSLFIYLLLLYEIQTGEAWEPSRKKRFFEIQTAVDTNGLSPFCRFWHGSSHQSPVSSQRHWIKPGPFHVSFVVA